MRSKVFLLMIFVYISLEQTFAQFKAQMEGKVKNIASQMNNLFTRRCDRDIVQCQIKSYNQCQGTDQKICYNDFPKATACLNDEVYLSQTSATRFPANINVSSLSEEERHFVCTSAGLQTSFHALNDGRNQRYGSAFVGTSLGSMRTYPTTKECADYDPRFRPWYVAATSGGKNVVLVIDVSGSMSGTRIDLARQAAKSVVNTLSNSDFVGVVKFSTEASTLASKRIVRATISHKNDLLSSIDSLGAGGGTNYQLAFIKAFQMFKSAQSDQFGSPCQNSENILLFLTDGYPTSGTSSATELISIIDSLNQFNIRMFTYGLGSQAEKTILYSLACRYKGIMFLVEDSSSSSQLTTLMRSYYVYAAEGTTVSNPVWTEPYEDFFGFGRLVTVSMPIYYQEGSIRKILGVAGIDVTIKALESFGFDNQTQITKQLLSESICLQSTLSDCDLQILRPSYSKCNISSCSSSGTISTCGQSIPNNIFLQASNTNDNICCGLSVGGLVGIVIAGVIVLVAVIITIACVLKNKQSQPKNSQLPPQQSKINL